MTAAAPSLYEVIDGTWPAADYQRLGPWVLREGKGGGSRVSAATLADSDREPDDNDLQAAEDAMRAMGQVPIFMIRADDGRLDRALARRGYAILDPVTIYAAPVTGLTDLPLPRVTVFTIWEPLAIMREIWADAGIGPARLAIMDRAPGPKTGLLARHRDKPAGAGFVAIHRGTAMVHALEILPHQRREGIGGWMMRGAALWAAGQGAQTISVMCTRENTGANALYASLGMPVVGQYHYRALPKETDPT